jgi:hypothetical protein
MICEALLFISAVFLYCKSMYQCFHIRTDGEYEETDNDTESQKDIVISPDNMYFYIRIRNTLIDGILPLYTYKECIIPVSSILKKQETSNSNEECPICLESLITVDVKNNNDLQTICELPCQHCYCESCIMPWIKKSPKCPLCNQHMVYVWLKKNHLQIQETD